MISRHGTVYYFRRRVPDDLQAMIGRRYIVKSLRTSVRWDATVHARILASKLDVIFGELRRMPDSIDRSLISGGFITLNIDLNERGSPKRVSASSEEHEVPALERLSKWSQSGSSAGSFGPCRLSRQSSRRDR
jgi:hypothetical protein